MKETTYEAFDGAIVKALTKRAVLLVIDGDDYWVPQSCIHEDDLAGLGVGVICEVNIATWFVEKEGL